MGNCANISNSSSGNGPIKLDKIKKNNSSNLQVKACTWNRDSHGLFDYENKQIVKNIIKIPEPGIIVRDKDQIKLEMNNQNYRIPSQRPDDEGKKLVSIEIRDSHYYVDSEYISSSLPGDPQMKKVSLANQDEGLGESCVWAIVKSLKTSKGTKGYNLQVGDFMKLGRVRFRIKELQGLESDTNEQEQQIQKKKQNFIFGSNSNVMDMDAEKQGEGSEKKEKSDTASNSPNACRICLGDTEEDDNPFITPCKCDGTMKCIHVKCLQQWLKSRLHPKETSFAISFVWKTFDCELCKSPFPNMVKVKGNIYDTVEISRPSAPYITLEILSKDRNICKGIHVITFSQKNQIRLGRGHDSDIRISDISVSRCHAMLSYEAGKFTVEDNNSKFGTLTLVKEPIQLNNNTNNLAIQVGRSVLSFTLKKNWKIFSVPIPPQSAHQQLDMTKDTHLYANVPSGMNDEHNANTHQNNMHLGAGQDLKIGGNPIKVITVPRASSQQQSQAPQSQHGGGKHGSSLPRSKYEVHEGEPSMSLQHLQTYMAPPVESQQVVQPYQLPEFKDPAEELEEFQQEKEKEQEIENLRRQLMLVEQHKAINQQNLNHLTTNQGVADTKHAEEIQVLKQRIDSYTIKIKDIQVSLHALERQNLQQPIKPIGDENPSMRGNSQPILQ